MDKKEAIELLEKALTEAPQLRELRHGNRKFTLWYDKVRNIIKAALDREDLERFSSWRAVHTAGMFSDEVYQEDYLGRLEDYETALESIIEKYKLLGFATKSSAMPETSPQAFIAHGGRSGVLDKLREFIEALGIKPVIVELSPTRGMTVDEKVDKHIKDADCGIVLATKGGIVDTRGSEKKQHPRLNVVDELERLRAAFPEKTILLLERGVDLPSNVSGLTYEPFVGQSMDRAFSAIARELTAYGILKAVKP
ncbi:MAG: hypothetical protein GH159_03930 [Dehalococcoidia bacterium]|nr:hypothetical protein [Dehalococcoidia bacterium]